MKAALFTGIFVLLLLATPTDSLALGLAEFGQEVGDSTGPVLRVAWPNDFANLFEEWQGRFVSYCLQEVVSLFCRVFQVLFTAVLLASYWLHRGQGLKRYVVKARRFISQPKINTRGRNLLSA